MKPLVLKKNILLEDSYNIVMVFSIRHMNRPWVYMCSLYPKLPSHLPPHPIPLGHHRAPTLGALLRASDLHWLSILHIVMYMFGTFTKNVSLV